MTKLTFLGTGTSHGVPAIDCMLDDYKNCPQGVCRAAQHDPLHVRCRCSLLVETDNAALLIDVSPDFRMQMLSNRVGKIDAVLLTHSHADHIYGLPDIRSYCRHGHAIDVYSAAETLTTLTKSFAYIFNPPAIKGGGIPILTTHTIRDKTPFKLFGLEIVPAIVEHGSLRECFGYRLGTIGYAPDIKRMPETTKAVFRGLDILILGALRRTREHSTHQTLEAAIALAKELEPKICYFTHISHDIHYQKDACRLPENMFFAHDGLRVLV
ncbi:MAG: MBL fold metallo-hydrolase [Gammaproteobacteria bacterium]|nr:MBL fold metallo-hydrolase [Gammaproteobacteria bacterium]